MSVTANISIQLPICLCSHLIQSNPHNPTFCFIPDCHSALFFVLLLSAFIVLSEHKQRVSESQYKYLSGACIGTISVCFYGTRLCCSCCFLLVLISEVCSGFVCILPGTSSRRTNFHYPRQEGDKLSEKKNEVRVGDRWCCQWTWQRGHCQQYWTPPQGLWSSSYFYQDWYFSSTSSLD